jgi:transcriptional regulator with XRE-family HTH domain
MPGPPNPLRHYRLRAGLTLEELADRVDRHKSTLSRIENGQAELSRELLPKLADALGIPPRKLAPDLADLMKRPAA